MHTCVRTRTSKNRGKKTRSKRGTALTCGEQQAVLCALEPRNFQLKHAVLSGPAAHQRAAARAHAGLCVVEWECVCARVCVCVCVCVCVARTHACLGMLVCVSAGVCAF